MDEPLSNLDAKLRVETRANIAALQARLGTTTVYVTHDQVEAMTMGHRVAVLKDGVLQQCDTPRNLYDRPKNAFVAGFIGSPAMNLRKVAVTTNGVLLAGRVLPVPESILDSAQVAGLSTLILGIRPESLAVGMIDGGVGVNLEVRLVEELGADAYVYGALKDDSATDKHVVVRFEGRVPPRIGEILDLKIRADELHAFHPDSGERIS